MGGSSSVTVGFRYFMGLHFAVCYGPVDALRRIFAGDRLIWDRLRNSVQAQLGEAPGEPNFFLPDPLPMETSGSIFISAGQVFGGHSREGGVRGPADVLMGEDTQEATAYLKQQLGNDIPAYRGVLSVVLRGPASGKNSIDFNPSLRNGYVSANNPYVKPWAFEVTRIKKGWSCSYVYPAVQMAFDPAATHSSLELSGNNLTVEKISDNTNHRASMALEAYERDASGSWYFEVEIDVGDAALSFILVGITPYSPGSITNYIGFASNQYSYGCTGFKFHGGGTSAYGSTFTTGDRIGVLLKHGKIYFSKNGIWLNGADPELETGYAFSGIIGTFVPGISIYAVGYSLTAAFSPSDIQALPEGATAWGEQENSDGWYPEAAEISCTPAENSSNGESLDAPDMNPAHIVYQCLTDPNWGMGYPTAMIDDDSFRAAADVLKAECFGLSMIWNQQDSIENFVQGVLDHCGGLLYADLQTGLFGITLIRDDYSPSDLPELGEDEISTVDTFQRPGYGELINELTVVYTERETNTEAAVTVQNLAVVQAQNGAPSAQTIQYPGITNSSLALRVAMRDLLTRSTPLALLTITTTRAAWPYKPGDVVKINWPPLGLDGLICRVLAVDRGTLLDGRIMVKLAEDIFGLPDSVYAEQQAKGWTEPDTGVEPIELQGTLEAPYWDIAREFEPGELAAVDADTGYGRTVAARESDLWTGYRLWARIDPADYAEAAIGTFAPTATLSADIGKTDAELTLTDAVELDEVSVGDRGLLGLAPLDVSEPADGSEWVGITAIDTVNQTLTVDRGVLDTVPHEWPAGTRIWFPDDNLGRDPTEYATGETVDYRLATMSTGGELNAAQADTLQLPFNQRFYRPYPPGRFRINGLEYPASVELGDLVISWAHRDRIQQTASLIPQDDGNIGPEAGTTYNVRVYDDQNDVLLDEENGITGTSYSPAISSDYVLRVELEAQRDGVVSWQFHEHVFDFGNPVGSSSEISSEISSEAGSSSETFSSSDGISSDAVYPPVLHFGGYTVDDFTGGAVAAYGLDENRLLVLDRIVAEFDDPVESLAATSDARLLACEVGDLVFLLERTASGLYNKSDGFSIPDGAGGYQLEFDSTGDVLFVTSQPGDMICIAMSTAGLALAELDRVEIPALDESTPDVQVAVNGYCVAGETSRLTVRKTSVDMSVSGFETRKWYLVDYQFSGGVFGAPVETEITAFASTVVFPYVSGTVYAPDISNSFFVSQDGLHGIISAIETDVSTLDGTRVAITASYSSGWSFNATQIDLPSTGLDPLSLYEIRWSKREEEVQRAVIIGKNFTDPVEVKLYLKSLGTMVLQDTFTVTSAVDFDFVGARNAMAPDGLFSGILTDTFQYDELHNYELGEGSITQREILSLSELPFYPDVSAWSPDAYIMGDESSSESSSGG